MRLWYLLGHPLKIYDKDMGVPPGFEAAADVCDEKVHDVPKGSLHGGHSLC